MDDSRKTEEKLMALYQQISGATELEARDVCIFLDVRDAREHPERFDNIVEEPVPANGI